MRTYFAHKQKFTTGEPIYVSHVGLFDTIPITLHIGPAAVLVKPFWIYNKMKYAVVYVLLEKKMRRSQKRPLHLTKF